MVHKSFILLPLCLYMSAAFAEVQLPDVGTVTKQIDSTLNIPSHRDDPTFFNSQDLSEQYSSDQTKIYVEQVIIDGNHIFSDQELNALIVHLENHENILADLQKSVDQLTAYYRQRGYFLTKAYLPKQRMDDGILKIQIVEGKLGQVIVHNESKVNDQVIQRYTDRISRNYALKENETNRALLLVTDLSGVGSIQANLQAGQAFGTTDLLIDVAQHDVISGRVSIDNMGSTYTGRYRLNSYVESNSALGFGEKLSAQLGQSNHDLLTGAVSAQIPIIGTGMSLGGSIGRTEYELGEQFSILDAKGVSENYQLNLNYPLLRSQSANSNLKALIEKRRLRDEISVTETQTHKESEVFRLSLDYSQQDGWGIGQSKGGVNFIELNTSIGQLDIQTPSSLNIDQHSAKTNGSFQKFELKLSRQQRMSDFLIIAVDVYGQLASKNLDSSEKFMLNKMRGYPSAEGLGDQGWGSSLALHYQVKPYLNVYLFQDIGQSEQNKTPYIEQDNRRTLASTGIGFMGGYKQFDYHLTSAWRNTDVATSDQDYNPRIQFQMGWRF